MDEKQQVLTDDELYLIFKLGKEEFGLPVKGVKEVLRVPAISQVPNAPHYSSRLSEHTRTAHFSIGLKRTIRDC